MSLFPSSNSTQAPAQHHGHAPGSSPARDAWTFVHEVQCIRQRCQLILGYAEAAEQTFHTAEAALKTAQQASALRQKMIAKVREIDTLLSSPMDDRDFVIEVAADLISGPQAARMHERVQSAESIQMKASH